MNAPKLYLALALSLSLSLLAACGPAQAQSDPGQSNQEQGGESQPQGSQSQTNVRRVRVLTAERGALTTQRSTSVNIEPGRESQIAAGTSGQVVNIVAREGAQVQEGDTVIRLDAENAQLQVENARTALQTARVNLSSAQNSTQESTEQARAALDAARTNLELARQQYEEGQQLFSSGGISQQQLTQFRAQLEGSQSSFQQAQANLSQLERAPSENLELQRLQVQQAQNQLAQAERAFRDATITAPFTGEVADVLVEQGEFIGSGSPAFRLVSTEEQLARFSVPPQDAGPLVDQGLVYIDYNGLDYGAQVVRSSSVPGESRLVNITARVYPSETRIPVGTVAQLNYEIALAEGVKIPSGAVRTQGGRSFVLALEEGSTSETVARQREVSVAGEAGGSVVVNGLEPGTRIVYPLPADLRDGTNVQVIGDAQ